MRSTITFLRAIILGIALAGCTDQISAPPSDVTSSAAGPSRSAVRTQTEFTGHVDATFYLSCVDQMTHWVGDFHAEIDRVQTESGITSITLKSRPDPDMTMTLANGVTYYLIGQGSTQQHQFFGPVQFINSAEPKVFRSADGDVVVTNFHFRLTFDDNGNPVSFTANGACP